MLASVVDELMPTLDKVSEVGLDVEIPSLVVGTVVCDDVTSLVIGTVACDEVTSLVVVTVVDDEITHCISVT